MLRVVTYTYKEKVAISAEFRLPCDYSQLLSPVQTKWPFWPEQLRDYVYLTLAPRDSHHCIITTPSACVTDYKFEKCTKVIRMIYRGCSSYQHNVAGNNGCLCAECGVCSESRTQSSSTVDMGQGRRFGNWAWDKIRNMLRIGYKY